MRRANGMGSITYLEGKRRKPWAVVTSTIIKGERRRRYVGYYPTKTEAEMALASEYSNPTALKHNISLERLYNEWQPEYYNHLSKQQQNCYNAAWRVYEPLYKRQVKEIRTGEVQKLIDASNKSKSSKDKMRGLYSLLCKYAMENDVINKNYAQFIHTGKATNREKEVFTDFELLKLEQAAPKDRTAQYILMMIYTGFRISEFLLLSPLSVNWKENNITGGLKTEAGKNRKVPIHPKVKEYFKQCHNENCERLVHKPDGSPYSVNYFRAVYKSTLEKYGIQYREPHCTRHTFATILIRNGASPETIKNLIGHTKYSFTVDTYDHISLQELRAAIEKMP